MCAIDEKPSDERQYDNTQTDYRTPFQRDRDRILYSSAFRRLAGVTQVAAVSEQRVLHNRLTHSLKVAQMGRRLAQSVMHSAQDEQVLADRSGIDPDVVEAACLAHDLGHPPFGHVAESVLHERVINSSDLDGFEGNAQSFRIVTKLAIRRESHQGLDLTRSVLDAILKYPRTLNAARTTPATDWTDRSQGAKWGVYDSERADFEWTRRTPGQERSANAVLMDWADDITFATHDIEDYYRAGLIPLSDLLRDRTEIHEHAAKRLESLTDFHSTAFSTALDEVIGKFTGGTPKPREWEARASRAWLNEVTTGNLTTLVSAVQIIDEPPYLKVDQHAQYLVEVLKELTWFYVIDRPQLAMVQEGQKHLIGSLYDRLYKCVERNPTSPRLPVSLKEIYAGIETDQSAAPLFSDNRPARTARAVADFICSMTEEQAVDLAQRLNGTSRRSMFGAWFH